MTDPSDTDAQKLGGLIIIVGWIGVGALSAAGLLFAIDTTVQLPLSRQVVVGLGLALGGGLGGVANFLYAGATPEATESSVTVDDSATTDPQPVDLFDGHPDPILYYGNADTDPVVRAANQSFGDTFDVPTDRLQATPLAEVLPITGDETVDVDGVTTGNLDCVVQCETGSGTVPFRVRTVRSQSTGYLLYTPVEEASQVSSVGD